MPSTGYVDQPVIPGLVERTLADGEVRYRSTAYFDGVQKLETWKGLTRTEAKKKHEARRVDIDKGVRPAREITIEELVIEAFAHYQGAIDRRGSNGQKPQISGPVLDGYRKMWEKRISSFPVGNKSVGRLRLSEFDRAVARRYLAWLAEPERLVTKAGKKIGLASQTQNGHKSAIRAVLRYAIDNDYLDRDPFAAIPRHEQPAQRPRPGWSKRVFSPDETALICQAACSEAFLAATPDVNLSAAVVFLADTGARLAEAGGVRWKSISVGEGRDGETVDMVFIREQRERQGADETATTKSELKHREDGQERAVAMSPRLKQAMQTQARHELEKGLGLEEQFCFTDCDGVPVTLDQIKSAVRRATRLAGLGEHGPHSLRHSYCTALAMSGVSSAEGAAIVGNSVQVFENDYVKPIRNATYAAAATARLVAFGYGEELRGELVE